MQSVRLLSVLSLTGLILAAPVYSSETPASGGEAMSSDDSKQIVLRLFDDVLNGGKVSVIDTLYAPDVVDHSAFPGQPEGVAGIKAAIGEFLATFDDLTITVEDIFAEGGKVVTRETWQATHKSSGKTVTGTVVHIFYVSDGRITDEWSRGWEWLESL